MPLAHSPELYEIITARWEAYGLPPGTQLQLDRRPPCAGELVLAQISDQLVVGVYDILAGGGFALRQPGRVVRARRRTRVRVWGVLMLTK